MIGLISLLTPSFPRIGRLDVKRIQLVTRSFFSYTPRSTRSTEQIEAATLKLDAKRRARLAERLLSSLETLSDAENARLWAEEAQRRDDELNEQPELARPAEDVFRDAKARLA